MTSTSHADNSGAEASGAPNHQYVTGHILGIELPVTDLRRATRFYEAVFHWDFFRYADSQIIHFNAGSISGIVHQVEDGDHYTLFHHHKLGFMTTWNGKAEMTRAVTFTIQVRDMRTTLDEVVRAGGRVWLKETAFWDNFPGRDGSFAYILDTEDNVIGLRSVTPADASHH